MTDDTTRKTGLKAGRMYIAPVIAGAVLVAYVCFLIVTNYRAERTQRRNLLDQFAKETALRAITVGYFIDSARENLERLAADRAVSAYFENRDLGMGREYGLALSTGPIRERFTDTIRRTRIGRDALFARIVLVDEDGAVLVDATDGSGSKRGAGSVPGPRARTDRIASSADREGIAISSPSLVRGRREGQVVGWIRPDTLYGVLVKDNPPGHYYYLATAGRPAAWLPERIPAPLPPSGLPPPDAIGDGDPHAIPGGPADRGSAGTVACRRPVKETPFAIVHIADAPAVLGGKTPLRHVVELSVAALAILLGTVYGFVLNVRALVLADRLTGSMIRESEIQQKNRELEVEIAERTKAQTAQARLSQAVEQAGEAIVITDPAGTIQYVNPAFERSTGYSRDEAIGRNPGILKSGRQDAAFYRALWETLARGESWSGTFVNRRKDGTLYQEVAAISPVRNADGAIVNYVAVKRDVTRELQMEEQLRQSQKMEAVGKLAGGIAHDFNNLLTAINGYSEILLMRAGLEAPARREIEEISKAGQKAASLTRQLLAFSRKQMLQPELLDLNAVTANMDRLLRRLIGEDIDLFTIPGPELWPIKVDRGQIEQVILNLVVNARDAMPRGGRITIETRNFVFDDDAVREHAAPEQPGPCVALEVSDTGSGMDEATRARVFEPFFTTKEQGKGTGMGLSTVYGIVKQSHGYVWVESEPDRGTTFTVCFPRANAQAEAAAPAVTSPPALTGEETILVTEDEPMVRDLVGTVLAENGYTLLLAKDGEEALSIAANHEGTINLLLTDVVMPRMSGRELATRITRVRPEIRVLFMSGYTEDAIIHHGVLEEGMSFIHKPFRVDSLTRAVRDALDRPARPAPAS